MPKVRRGNQRSGINVSQVDDLRVQIGGAQNVPQLRQAVAELATVVRALVARMGPEPVSQAVAGREKRA